MNRPSELPEHSFPSQEISRSGKAAAIALAFTALLTQACNDQRVDPPEVGVLGTDTGSKPESEEQQPVRPERRSEAPEGSSESITIQTEISQVIPVGEGSGIPSRFFEIPNPDERNETSEEIHCARYTYGIDDEVNPHHTFYDIVVCAPPGYEVTSDEFTIEMQAVDGDGEPIAVCEFGSINPRHFRTTDIPEGHTFRAAALINARIEQRGLTQGNFGEAVEDLDTDAFPDLNIISIEEIQPEYGPGSRLVVAEDLAFCAYEDRPDDLPYTPGKEGLSDYRLYECETTAEATAVVAHLDSHLAIACRPVDGIITREQLRVFCSSATPHSGLQ